MHKIAGYVQLFADFLFSLNKNAFLCTAKIKTNLYLLIKKLKVYV
jgi:hypothetical protein